MASIAHSLLPIAFLVWIFPRPEAAAQELPVKGSDETLDVATWNIEHFGNPGLPPDDAAQLENAAAVIRQAEIDLWAIQEIYDVDVFHRLTQRLGGAWSGVVDEASTNAHVGFIYKRDVISVLSASNRLIDYAHEFAGRPPLMIEAAVTLADRTFPIWFITLHMKAFSDASSYERRLAAGRHLKNHIDSNALADKPVIVLGDFNDELVASIASGRRTPYEAFLADTARYRFITMPLDEAGHHTWCETNDCRRGSTIDHILITDELFDVHASDAIARYDELIDPAHGIADYTTTTSDHLPVYARFRFPTEQPVHAPSFQLTGIFPNPVRDAVNLRYTATGDGAIAVHVFDILGRKTTLNATHQITSGAGIIPLDVRNCAAGVYFLRVDGGVSHAVTSFVVVR